MTDVYFGRKVRVVRSKGPNDCDECPFSLKCIDLCFLHPGYHYELVEES